MRRFIKKLEASYTVEMALLLPVVLFVMFAPVFMAYEMYEQTKQVSVCGWDASFCAEDKLWNIKFAKSMWEELK